MYAQTDFNAGIASLMMFFKPLAIIDSTRSLPVYPVTPSRNSAVLPIAAVISRPGSAPHAPRHAFVQTRKRGLGPSWRGAG